MDFFKFLALIIGIFFGLSGIASVGVLIYAFYQHHTEQHLEGQADLGYRHRRERACKVFFILAILTGISGLILLMLLD